MSGGFYKVAAALSGRRGLVSRVRDFRDRAGRAPWWFHVASSGELEQCLPILDAMKFRTSEPVFLSYFSPTGERAISLEAERRKAAGAPAPWDYADYCPWDLPVTVGNFLEALRPRRLVIVHREIWPGLIRGCAARGIPVALVATHFRGDRPVPRWYRGALSEIDAVVAVDETTERVLGPYLRRARTARLGDPRAERALARAARDRAERWARLPGRESRLVLGSLWPRDFEALKEGLETLGGRWQLVLAPHQPESEFVGRLVEWAGRLGPVAVWSQWRENPSPAKVIVVDTVGELAEIYALGSVAFVGGSFRSRVHNVLEPAAHGIPVLTGPHIQNSLEAQELEGKGLARLESGAELTRLLDRPERLSSLREGVSRYFDAVRGTGARYADFLLSL